MEHHSMVEVREAERQAKRQRLGFRHLLRIDESKAGSSTAIMVLRRMKAAAEAGRGYDAMLGDRDVNRISFLTCGLPILQLASPAG